MKSSRVLLALVAALALVGRDARSQDAAKATLAVASEPLGAAVYICPSRGEPPRLERDRLVGRTPLEVRFAPGPVEVVVAKEGYVLKVEPVDLRAGSASRLEVRLAKDIEVPRGITLAGGSPLAKTAKDGEALYDRVLGSIVGLYVEEKDPRALIDGSVKTAIATLDAVRARDQLLRRELTSAARARYYRPEVDLHDYPPLVYEEHDLGVAKAEGQGVAKRWTLSAGGASTDGVTDPADPETYWRKVRRVVSFLRGTWDARGVLDDSMITRCLIEGLVGALDDQHTHFLPPDALKDFGSEAKGMFGGIGVVVALKDGKLTVVASIDGTPGARAGLLTGDTILAIDGRPTDVMSLADAVAFLRGAPDSKIELLVAHGDAPPRKLEIVRAAIKVRATKRSVLRAGANGPPLGYIRITSFMPEDVDKEFAGELDALEKAGVRGLVIDLRNNPGGLLDKACQIADMFVEDGPIVTTRARVADQSRALLATKDAPKHRLPLVVLVNEGSASASEVLAGTLRDHKLAVLVGEKTYGKGSVQRVVPLEPFECAIALTVATYHLPSGITPHKRGLEPDVVVRATEDEKARVANRSVYRDDDGKDPQLDAALEALAKRIGAK